MRHISDIIENTDIPNEHLTFLEAEKRRIESQMEELKQKIHEILNAEHPDITQSDTESDTESDSNNTESDSESNTESDSESDTDA